MNLQHLCLGALFFALLASTLQFSQVQAAESTSAQAIDLATALRLAGAQNLDIQLAREKVLEAKARQVEVQWQFLPWLAPGIAYRHHDHLAQDTPGNLLDVDRQSYAPGGTLQAQVDFGDAIYKSLVARQVTAAAAHGLEAQRQQSVLMAATDYFELAMAQAGREVAREALRIGTEYEAQVQQAVDAGLAFKGDALRARVQTERDRLLERQAQEHTRTAAARLAQTLHLDARTDLRAVDADLVPLALVETNATADSLISETLARRPEFRQSEALVQAARQARQGAVYGPLIPSVGAAAFFGGLGGGPGDAPDQFGAQQDYFVGLSWRIGPGGLFDSGRRSAAEARWESARIEADKQRDGLMREVVELFTRYQSQLDQLASARRALAAADEGFRLARDRKQFAVGIVLENIQAEQDLTRARLDYLHTITELNKVQYGLLRATGRL